ncbi:sensor domain-containing diguanylate cyclase [Bacillus sp. FJAT-49736]|uniref:sensor domain-containing diguanylate cyclase n=1 Tax=Bacillus sp. FJAT-49736 TaxID=2833582 RepID=UPI001BC90913|nr:sensor domain-containing diguanylate cyclase [Bacillus sp. FJAT-49736]MBS4174069.1 GGDEF domain-containing protein [Bacillus sp. FJAT-49736]
MLQGKRIRLGTALSLLVLFTILFTLIGSLYSAQKAMRTSLANSYLDSNYKYAKKLASSTSQLLEHMQLNVNTIAGFLSHDTFSQLDLDAWKRANEFNSIFITDTNGTIQLISPSIIQYKGRTVKAGERLQSETMKKALSIKKPFISHPYRGASGQLIVLISSPIFNTSGNYKGVIGGTIYLESDNALNSLLREHEMKNGSYVYVVNSEGRILYHPDKRRIYEDVSQNKVVQKLMQGQSGHSKVINSQGKEFFAGYTYEKNSDWGIVSQTPTYVIGKPLFSLMKKVAYQSLPILCIILFVSWIVARNLSKPINVLAEFTEDAYHKSSSVEMEKFHVKSRIYEFQKLFYHTRNYLNLLNNQVQIDGLTGLANRRTMEAKIQEWFDEGIAFSVIMLDIDHFKKVNDTFGHLAGDDVLKFLSSLMMQEVDTKDLAFRYGGEEFGILVKHKQEEQSFTIAETLRKLIETVESPIGSPITASLGISSRHENDRYPKDIINRADQALYQSKNAGRNRTTIYHS